MTVTLYRPKPKRSSTRSRTRVGQGSPIENRSFEIARKQPRSSRLDNRHWQPYRNDPELAQRIYDLTHLDNRPLLIQREH